MPTKARTIAQRRPRPPTPRPADTRASSASRGYDRHWARIRSQQLRAEPLCRFCRRPASLVDHIQPLSQGGARLEQGNLRSCCRGCHALLTANLRHSGRNELTREQLEYLQQEA